MWNRLRQVPGLSEDYAISCIIGGLYTRVLCMGICTVNINGQASYSKSSTKNRLRKLSRVTFKHN